MLADLVDLRGLLERAERVTAERAEHRLDAGGRVGQHPGEDDAAGDQPAIDTAQAAEGGVSGLGGVLAGNRVSLLTTAKGVLTPTLETSWNVL